jgi:hypothetical protein
MDALVLTGPMQIGWLNENFVHFRGLIVCVTLVSVPVN